jgi:hypothetical protein
MLCIAISLNFIRNLGNRKILSGKRSKMVKYALISGRMRQYFIWKWDCPSLSLWCQSYWDYMFTNKKILEKYEEENLIKLDASWDGSNAITGYVHLETLS